MTWGIVAGAAIGLVGAAVTSDSAHSASNTQADAAREANTTDKYMYDQTRSDNMPALLARNNGLTGYQNLLGNPSRITSDPGYKFGLDQGTRAINSQAAAHGSYYSGATLKALNQFGQDYGQSQFDKSLNRYGNQAGLGQVGSNTMAMAGQNYANNVGNNLMGAANARGAATIAQGNAWGNAINGLGYYGSQMIGRGGGMSNPYGDPAGTVPGGYDMGGVAYNNPSAYEAGSIYSDERLKTNIRRTGTTARGNAWYEWDWKSGGRGQGVIAQEVAHIPGAVQADSDGVLMVDYSKV